MRAILDNKVIHGILNHIPRHISLFFVIGVITTLTDMGLLYLLTEYMEIWYITAAAGSYCCGAALSYTLNKTFNFKNQSQAYFRQFSTFLIISATSLCLNLAIIATGVEIFSLSPIEAKVVATAIAFFWNYFGQSRLTFRRWK